MQMPSCLHDIIQKSETPATQRGTRTALQTFQPQNHNKPPQTLYALYSYTSDLEDGQIRSNWRLEYVTDDRLKAFETAKDLYKNPHFDKIEIKKTAYDHKNKTPTCAYEVCRAWVESRLFSGLSSSCFAKVETGRLNWFQSKSARTILWIPPVYLSRIWKGALWSNAQWKPDSQFITNQQLLYLGKIARSKISCPLQTCRSPVER
jgi:hypothetical protein